MGKKTQLSPEGENANDIRIGKLEAKLDKERAEFRRLVLENPNYFGTLKDSPFKPVKKLIVNTQYEELTCVGFSPDTNFLEATIAVKLPNGYGGNLCMAGTTEYVRFFIDYGSG